MLPRAFRWSWGIESFSSFVRYCCVCVDGEAIARASESGPRTRSAPRTCRQTTQGYSDDTQILYGSPDRAGMMQMPGQSLFFAWSSSSLRSCLECLFVVIVAAALICRSTSFVSALGPRSIGWSASSLVWHLLSWSHPCSLSSLLLIFVGRHPSFRRSGRSVDRSIDRSRPLGSSSFTLCHRCSFACLSPSCSISK